MIIHGDSLDELKKLPENSVDALVTDPPYGWRFMGKAWDAPDIDRIARQSGDANRGPRMMADGRVRNQRILKAEAAGKYDNSPTGNQAFQTWTEAWAREALRVLKPGGHALIFCGPRTYHRMASGVEDAGFEIRDQLQWLFGSGFPKSMNVAIAIDKAAAATDARGQAFNTAGQGIGLNQNKELRSDSPEYAAYSPKTDDAKRWQGFGTALKPANEPVVLARKPLSESTVAKNVLRWGTGALNIDASRVGHNEKGRWPANVLFDEDAAAVLDGQSGKLKGPGNTRRSIQAKSDAIVKFNSVSFSEPGINNYPGQEGGASRFFYVAKASKRERNAGLEGDTKQKQGARPNSADASGKFPDHDHRPSGGNNHPTVKPIRLMEYLIRLVTPPGGTVLDPFLGSGTTGVAAIRLGFKLIGIEREAAYVEIASRRIEHAQNEESA